MVKAHWILTVLSLVASSNAYGSKLVSKTTYSNGSVHVYEGINDDGFSKPDSICYEGDRLTEACDLAYKEAGYSREAYHNGHGYFEITSCEMSGDPMLIHLKYDEITDYDRGEPNHVEFTFGHCAP